MSTTANATATKAATARRPRTKAPEGGYPPADEPTTAPPAEAGEPEAEERAVPVGAVQVVDDGDAHRVLIGRSRRVKPLWVSHAEALAMRDALVLRFGTHGDAATTV